jgi:hypothetical protein
MNIGGGPDARQKLWESPDAAAKRTAVEERDFTGRAKAARRKALRRGAARGAAAVWARTKSLGPSMRNTFTRIPRAAKVCALLAFVNAACWSLITPPFQAPDEPDHFAYVQLLAETHSLPSSNQEEDSPQQAQIMFDLHYSLVRFRPAAHAISSHAEYTHLQHDLAAPLSKQGGGGTGLSYSEPPLYYALQTIPYAIGSIGSLLDQLELMRLLSALMGGLTALFAFLFLREALPGAPWAWTVGGVGVALSPLLGFISGAVNPDALLFVVSAALFYCLARAFRRGLTQRSALTIGGLIALGFVTKLNFVGLAPGAILGLLLLARRQARISGPRVYYRLLAPALSIAVAPGVLYGLVNLLSGHPTFGILSKGASGLTGVGSSISGELSYIWQFYLPRLPWMHSDFGSIFTTRQIWFKDLIGLYGWSDTVFPGWAYNVALVPVGLIAILCIREMVRGRAALRSRVGEILTYAAIGVGVMALVGADGYLAFPRNVASYAEPRYMLPMVALWGAVLALAARGAGRRWGPPAGALIVVLVMGHDIFSQLQVIARYYG